MANNENFNTAKKNKSDEFYTQLVDIENELKYYEGFFFGKTVYCNCDDAEKSNFVKYFIQNFQHLGLKKLIASCYNENGRGRCFIYEGDNGVPEEIGKFEFDGNGDFRSAESIELLEEADIVVTNPPFSLFREYIAQLMEYGKKFIIVGNMNAITYKEVFPLIKENKLWFGPSISSGDRKFNVPDDYDLNAYGCGIDEDGKKFIRVKGVRWFTNLDHNKRHQELVLSRTYNEEDYPKYDNYDAIEVSKTKNIPCDYNGIMGVPITFLDKYNPNQFEIIWQAIGNTRKSAPKDILERLGYKQHKEDRGGCTIVRGKRTYGRILIKKIS